MKHRTNLIVGVTAIAVTGLAGWQAWKLWAHAGEIEQRVPAETGARNRVELSLEKFAQAKILLAEVSRRELRPWRIVPGRIDYNATRHVRIKSPFDGLIRRIDVKVGDQVTDGQVMAIVDSPELGERRADVLLRQTDLEQATNEHDWWHEIQANVDELIARLKRPQEISLLEKEFADKLLGGYRQQILTAYSRMRLAEKLNSNVKPAGDAGAVSVRMVLELGSARDTTAAEYTAACEQATFDVKQKHLKAESAMKDAERRLAVAKQRLELLTSQPQETLLDAQNEGSLSTWPVRAPFTGTVEEVLLAPKERVQMAEGLLQLADASHLWVQADIRERDWSALAIARGQTISVQTPALPGKTLSATVAFVGRTVGADTRAVPLTADIDNPEGVLRPGMFVRVLIPDGAPRDCLTVPQSSITMNDGRTFVFIETGTREYRPRDVTTGLSVDPWIEITSGLKAGDRVVTDGVPALKAELLLESDE
jgi:cobalt-zinc-cadmium efflux system membrane fusion protein